MTDRLNVSQAQALARQYFDVEGQLTELGGERTQNFRVQAADGSGFTLKVSDPQESVDGVLLENEALLHIEKVAAEIAVPRVTRSIGGEAFAYLGPDDGRYLRLLTYLEGMPLSTIAEPSKALRRAVGDGVAKLDKALASFNHPYLGTRDLIWDVKNISRLRPYIELIDAARRPLAQAMLDRFETIAAPRLAQLPAQAVHSDMNAQNILVNADQLAGFLDFGDLVHAPRIIDLAGAALLQIRDGEDDLSNAVDVAVSYHNASSLSELEIDFLPELMMARCIINVIVTEFLADRDPANRNYIMKNNPVSWMRLERLSSLSLNPFTNVHLK